VTGLADLVRVVGEIAHGWCASRARAHAYGNDTNLDGYLPPAWAEGDAWFRLYPEVALPVVVPAPAAPAPHQRRTRSAPTGPSIASLKADVLNRLGNYQVYVDRLRKHDRAGYNQFKRVGMYVIPGDQGLLAHRYELEPALLAELPGFGAVAMSLDDDSDPLWIPARFVYFVKLDRPGRDIQVARDGVVYRCHVYWDDATDKVLNRQGYQCGVGLDFAVQVLPSGEIRVLRMLCDNHQVIKHRKSRDPSVIQQRRWKIPPFEARDGLTPEQRVHELFCLMMNFWVQAARSSMIRVTATKGRVVMPFVVDVLQTPRFFDDREPVVIDGKTRRIFHIVRTHIRHTKRGALPIRTHFAGLRRFRWNGYDIDITVPGRDHKDLASMTIGALEDVPPNEEAAGKFIELEEMANIVADVIGSPQVAA
jgi:hypothetical protein